MTEDFDAQVAGVAALHDPLRRSLYRCVVESSEPVSREQAAAAVGIKRSLAAFHLERLVDEGLLDFEFRRLTGRSGPGAGRPAKLYRRADREIEVSLPPRAYDIAGSLLARAIDAAERTGRGVREELERASTELGVELAREASTRSTGRRAPARERDTLLGLLRGNGFEPRAVGDDVVLANCPFHALAQQHTDLVCGMNLHLLEGVRSALDLPEDELRPRLEPEPGQCCVKLCREG